MSFLIHAKQFVRWCRQKTKQIGTGIGIQSQHFQCLVGLHLPENTSEFKQSQRCDGASEIETVIGFIRQRYSAPLYIDENLFGLNQIGYKQVGR